MSTNRSRTYAVIGPLAFIVVALVLAVGVTWAADGPTSTVHALSVVAEPYAPCAGWPQLDAPTLAFIFAPAVAQTDPSPVAIVDVGTFTMTVHGKVYTATVSDSNTATVDGPDDASSALFARDIGGCLGGVTVTRTDAPGRWTDAGAYVPMDASPVADR